jgi:hypothetical protein
VRRSSRQRLLGVTVLVVGSGVAAGLAAASGLGPFATTHSTSWPSRLAALPQHAVRADKLFPLPTPGAATVRVIQVNDPTQDATSRRAEVMPVMTPFSSHDNAPGPAAGVPTLMPDEAKPTPTPAPTSTPMPTPTPKPTPSPTPCPDDGCGGGGV